MTRNIGMTRNMENKELESKAKVNVEKIHYRYTNHPAGRDF